MCVGGGGGNPLGALGFCLTNQTEAATALQQHHQVKPWMHLALCEQP